MPITPTPEETTAHALAKRVDSIVMDVADLPVARQVAALIAAACLIDLRRNMSDPLISSVVKMLPKSSFRKFAMEEISTCIGKALPVAALMAVLIEEICPDPKAKAPAHD